MRCGRGLPNIFPRKLLLPLPTAASSKISRPPTRRTKIKSNSSPFLFTYCVIHPPDFCPLWRHLSPSALACRGLRCLEARQATFGHAHPGRLMLTFIQPPLAMHPVIRRRLPFDSPIMIGIHMGALATNSKSTPTPQKYSMTTRSGTRGEGQFHSRSYTPAVWLKGQKSDQILIIQINPFRE